ncbi:MAG: LuxR C-terminal-related transcriptional regulator [Gordonibacter pamelaeae]
MQFLNISRRDVQEHEQQNARQESVLVKIMGLDEHESLADVRQASMRHNAEEMGRQFLLSDREMEVLALYALGYTQKRVAEELYITPGTAHAYQAHLREDRLALAAGNPRLYAAVHIVASCGKQAVGRGSLLNRNVT